MSILSTEVEVTLSNRTINYYKQKGYCLPQELNSKLKVKVSDLPNGSNVRVDVECDCCNKKYKLDYYDYVHGLHDGNIYCKNCAPKMLLSGENHYAWKTDRTPENYGAGRNTIPYRDFLHAVLIRDKYTCRCCGNHLSDNCKIVVHHLNGYSWSESERVDIKNGIALCEKCHKNFHSIYGKKNNTKEQFEEWIGDIVTNLEVNNNILPESRRIYCVEENKIYDNAYSLAKEWNLSSHASIYIVCNHYYYENPSMATHDLNLDTYKFNVTIKGKHLLWYDDYKNMTNEELKSYIKNNLGNPKRKVVCTTTKKVFDTIAKAKKFYNCDSHISDCCNEKRNFCGRLDDGTPLKWMYYEDYIDLYPNKLHELENIKFESEAGC